VRYAWYALSLAMAIWAVGAFGNLWQEMVLHRQNEMYRASMLAFNLAVVPTTYLLASDWRLHGRQLLRAVDALVALALGCAYFLYTWHMINDHSAPGEAGVAYLVWLLDLQNLYLAAGALVRWYVAEDRDERDLFRALAVYTFIYFVIVFINDHYFAGNPAFGPEYGTVVTLAFAVLCSFALRAPSVMPVRSVNSTLVRMVRSGSPILLALALLTASLFLIRVEYLWGCAGILIAVVGIGVRTTLIQVHQIEHREALRREASALQSIAWTDALTGVPNRHFFTEALARAWRSERRPGRQAILMIDIDHFKHLNDTYGHRAGDQALRHVAQRLSDSLREGDLLARWGGEEFLAVLPDTDIAQGMAVAERLCELLAALPIAIGEADTLVAIQTSIGLAEYSDETLDALVDRADLGLYQAKAAGRNTVRASA